MYKSWMWKQRSYREQFQSDETAGGTGGTEVVIAEQSDEQQSEQAAGEQQSAEQQEQAAQPEEDEVVVTIGDAEPPTAQEDESKAPEWVRELRKAKREQDRELRELRAKLAEKEAASKPAEVAKPTLADCDYDEDEYAAKLLAWNEHQAQVKAEQDKKAKEAQAAQEAWQQSLDKYGKAKAALKVADYDDAEAVVSTLFSQTQKGIIVHAADNPALLEYAIGKNPAKAKELAAITDPVKFAFAVAKLETQVKATPRKAPPPPEKIVSGSSAVAGSSDAQLARLEAEADRTGDRSKVIAYKRELKARQAA